MMPPANSLEQVDEKISASRIGVEGKIDELERRIEKLKLYNAALTAVLILKLGISEREIGEMVNALDLQDGKIDATYTPAPAQCTSCGKVLSKDLERCMYCGTLDTARSFLDRL